MKRIIAFTAVWLLLCLGGCQRELPPVTEATPAPTAPPVSILSPTSVPVATAAPTPTPEPTAVPTFTPEPTPESILLGDQSYRVDTALLSAETVPYEQLLSALPAFTALEELRLGDRELSYEQAAALKAANPAAKLSWQFSFLGKSYTTDPVEADLTGARIKDMETLKTVLSLFNPGTVVDMSDCSLSNEELALLRDEFPSVKLVWTVRFRRWSLRTDALCFSTKQYSDNTSRLTAKDVQPLSYCRDLLLLDLGHNYIDDISFILPMKNLQLIILGDNPPLRDLSLLGQMKELIYVECFMTKISDCSFVRELPKLLDLNLCYTKIKDISPILDCPQLERIWLGGLKEVPQEQWEQLRTAFPQAQMELRTEAGGSTGGGWRDHERYMAYYNFFKTKEPQAPFLPPQQP